MNTQFSKLSYALEYARRGMRVFPLHYVQNGNCSCRNSGCTSAGKHPINSGWQNDATKDETIIDEAWRIHRYANIGVACGAGSGLFVLDVDGELGKETLADLEQK